MGILNGLTQADSWENLRRQHTGETGVNVGRTERWVSAAAATALGTYALRARRMRALLLPVAGGLLARAITGHCPVNQAIGRNSAETAGGRVSPVASPGVGEGVGVEERIVINRPAEEIFRFWRDFENLPRFTDHLESVTNVDAMRSHWIARAPAGTRVEWDAEVHNEIPGELIAWRSLAGADVPNAGSVRFRPAPDGVGTEVHVTLRYDPPAGRLGAGVARLFGEEPSRQIRDDLRRLKQVIESTEIASPTR